MSKERYHIPNWFPIISRLYSEEEVEKKSSCVNTHTQLGERKESRLGPSFE